MATPLNRAYDAVAPEYDRQVQRDQWVRRSLWRHFATVFREGDLVLDAGCGTGIDTIHLASCGVRVTAVDQSANMTRELRTKLEVTGLAARVDVHVGDVAEIGQRLAESYDGIVASFAAMNTFDLPAFAASAARLLKPGGRLVAHLLSPGYAARGFADRWMRVLRPSEYPSTVVVDIERERVHHALMSDRAMARRFAPHFVRRGAYAHGLFVSRAVERILPEPALDALARLEARVSCFWPLSSAGRFYVLDLEKRRDGAAA